MAKNYYIILGIDPDASQQEIKSAYRKLAKELHPDQSGKDSAPFIDVQEAYAILSDPERRQHYDADRRRRRTHEVPVEVSSRPRRKRSPIEPVSPHERPGVEEVFLTRSFETYSPSFDEIFDRLWRNFTGATRPKSERLESLSVEVILNPDEARHGGEVRINVPVHATCPTCRGRGGVGLLECLRCAGKGSIDGEVPVPVRYPAGLTGNHTVRIPLNRFGIHNYYLTVHFRVSQENA
ncbi:J domain-containing protein [candidate division KSB1 bacterium]|nr:J domain-containing protein [candidate division KSB1 bacterium]NIR72009.1 J domain-containing protein [candidate division KSB1 bacterium]NIS25002.1 J domain-containing protein [candidate division KSB1 bacterium]NIT71918.1 J domain-containing protein [candidate division KSB1 bacterium]NIU25657.1 J domain-containing protein [candidate division KSB1 bacterium]